MPTEKRIEFPCEIAAGRDAARQLKEFLAAQGLNEELQFACELSLTEACNNAVHHYPKNGNGRLPTITAEAQVHPGLIELRVVDRTAGFNYPGKLPPPAPDTKTGRGLFLIQSMMDEVSYERGSGPGQNTLVMKKRIEAK